jgi:Tfp pilus assembly protein PilZ
MAPSLQPLVVKVRITSYWREKMEYFHTGTAQKTRTKERRKKAKPAANEKSERRQKNRQNLDLWITDPNYVPLNGKKYPPPRLLDLSMEGAFISGAPAQLHSEIHFQLVLPNCISPLKIAGQVVWSRMTRDEKSNETQGGIGVRFTHLSDENRKTLLAFLEAWPKGEKPKSSPEAQLEPPWLASTEKQPTAILPSPQKTSPTSLFQVSEDEIDRILWDNFDK